MAKPNINKANKLGKMFATHTTKEGSIPQYKRVPTSQ